MKTIPEFKTYYYFQWYFGPTHTLIAQLANPQQDCVGENLTGKWIKAKDDAEAKKKMSTEIKKGKKMAEGLTQQDPAQPFCFVAIQLITGRGGNERVVETFTIESASHFISQGIRQKLTTLQLLQENSTVN